MKPCIVIAVPTHRSTIDMACARSIMAVQDQLTKKGMSWRLLDIDSAEIAWARNRMAAMMLMSDPKFTHILFIDNDMAFSPKPVIDMLSANREVIGCIYPQRFSWNVPVNPLVLVARSARIEPDDNMAIGKVSGFVVYNFGRPPVFKDDIAEVEAIGMGLCLIARTAFEKIIAAGNISERRGPIEPGHPNGMKYYGFFDQIIDNNQYQSEDRSFCRRWRECGGKVYALRTKEIAHIARVEVRAFPTDHPTA